MARPVITIERPYRRTVDHVHLVAVLLNDQELADLEFLMAARRIDDGAALALALRLARPSVEALLTAPTLLPEPPKA